MCQVIRHHLPNVACVRYYAIIYPMRAQYRCTMSKARRLCVLIWLLSLLLAAPVLVVQVSISTQIVVINYSQSAYYRRIIIIASEIFK